MKLLEEKIQKDARLLEGNIVKVDSFLNHQLDVAFLDKLAEEFAKYFSKRGINKILTIEASGIALAVLLSKHMDDIPVVFAKKAKSLNIGDDVFTSSVESFTYKKEYTITVSKKYLSQNDKLVIVDDFLAEGMAMKGLIDVAKQAGSQILGLGVAIEKGFQKGGKFLRQEGYDLCSLAIIDEIKEDGIVFRK
ncbi:xanthine phosphoribosyltransferase [Peptoniphilus sp. GNH]|nr:xanthine phosphoribosyltransferase [Peptoniphilus sp. GNH]